MSSARIRPAWPALLLMAACAGDGAPEPDGPVAAPPAPPAAAEPDARGEAGTDKPPPADDAQDPAFGGALEEAWYRHPRMRAARARILAGHGFELQADLWPNPELSAGVVREAGEKYVYPVTLAQRFELGGKQGARVSAAAARTFVAETEARETWVAVRADVKAALVRRAYARETLRLREAIRDLDAEARDLLRSRVDAGKEAEPAWQTARERAARSAAAAAAARALLEDAGRQVDAALGRPPETSEAARSFDGAGLDVTSPAADRFDRLLALAKAHSPRLATAGARVAAAAADEQLSRTRQWSDAVLSIGVRPTDRDDGRFRVGWMAGVSIGIPIWDRGQGETRAREELLRAAREDEAQAALAVGARVSRVSADAARWEAEARSHRETILPAAARRAELAADLARRGKTGRLAALDATRAHRTRELEAARARLMRSAAVIELERIVGSTTGADE